jgi:hypothetical protein
MGNTFRTTTIASPFVGATSKQRLAGFDVTVAWPKESVRGVTFLLPGAFVGLTEYDATSHVLLEKGQIVLSFFINVFAASHDQFAARLFHIFQDFYSKNPHLPDQFSIVGHSVGGKIALLATVLAKPEQVKLVLALDPVDERPPEFTLSEQSSGNKTLENATATVFITWATATPSNKIDPEHNAQAIYRANGKYLSTALLRHEHAGHFAYTDHGGGLPGMLIIAGTPEGNKAARDNVHDKIRELF